MKIKYGLLFLSIFCLFACTLIRTSKTYKNEMGDLTSGEWVLVSVMDINQDTILTTGTNRRITLRMNKDGNYFGFDGCNNFQGKYSFSTDSIRFYPGISTRKACLDTDPIDSILPKSFEDTNTYSIEENYLILKKDNESLMVYKQESH